MLCDIIHCGKLCLSKRGRMESGVGGGGYLVWTPWWWLEVIALGG